MKKITLLLLGVVVVAGGVAAVSAFEAHIINVTAHIENALHVATTPIVFGTVFPQEYFTDKTFEVSLSQSFIDAPRVDDVNYVIKQKAKCICESTEYANINLCPVGKYAPVDYATDVCPTKYHQMESLCPFLSKTTTDANDTSHPSYYNDPTPGSPNSGDESCQQPEHVMSPTMNFSSTGWAGWSCPAGKHVVGGTTDCSLPLAVSQAAKPGVGTYPVYPHYTYTPPEEGWVVQNGGTGQSCKIYVDCLANIPDATGKLWKHNIADLSDLWTVDLKVPPVKGFVGQDWPAGCPTVPTNDVDYGCDLWIEVTGISTP